MGLFDYVTCYMPMPGHPAGIEDAQTKDTPAQFMDRYEIRADGTLWHEDYDTEDRGDPNAEGLMRLGGMMTRVNKRWRQLEDFDGVIDFDRYRVVFIDGKVAKGPVAMEKRRCRE